MSAKKYEVPQVDGFTEEKVMEALKDTGELEQYAVEVPDTSPEPVVEPTVESEPAPVPPKEDVTDEPEEGNALPKTIPYERFAEAQRKAREKEAEYQRKVEELLREQQDFMRKQIEAAQKRVPEPEPVEEDPLKVLIRTEAEEMVKPIRQQLEAKERMTALQARIEQAEAEVEKAFPDYKQVAEPVQKRMAEAAQAAQRGDQNAARWLQSILMDENPPLKAYMIGRWEMARAGVQSSQQNTVPQTQVTPQAPMRGNPPALPRGTQVQGSSNNETSEASKVANMSLEEYAAWRAKNPALVKRYLRGQD